MLAILDVNVFVSAIVTPGGPADRLVAAAEVGAVTLVVSPRLLAELSDVLHRHKFRRHLSPNEADQYVEGVRRMALLFPDPDPTGAHVRDVKDDYLVELTRSVRVAALVSGDKDLLAVDPAVVRVLTPREALGEMGR